MTESVTNPVGWIRSGKYAVNYSMLLDYPVRLDLSDHLHAVASEAPICVAQAIPSLITWGFRYGQRPVSIFFFRMHMLLRNIIC
jgi:hypothetical protein